MADSQVFSQQEAQWRLQFLEQILYVEATPSIFIPSFIGANVGQQQRSGSYIQGKLSVKDSDG